MYGHYTGMYVRACTGIVLRACTGIVCTAMYTAMYRYSMYGHVQV